MTEIWQLNYDRCLTNTIHVASQGLRFPVIRAKFCLLSVYLHIQKMKIKSSKEYIFHIILLKQIV